MHLWKSQCQLRRRWRHRRLSLKKHTVPLVSRKLLLWWLSPGLSVFSNQDLGPLWLVQWLHRWWHHGITTQTLTRIKPLRWRHNDHAGVSNHQPHGCLLNRLFRRKSKKTSKLRVTGHCAGNSPGTGEFPAQMASYAENVSIWWRHHAKFNFFSEISEY